MSEIEHKMEEENQTKEQEQQQENPEKQSEQQPEETQAEEPKAQENEPQETKEQKMDEEPEKSEEKQAEEPEKQQEEEQQQQENQKEEEGQKEEQKPQEEKEQEEEEGKIQEEKQEEQQIVQQKQDNSIAKQTFYCFGSCEIDQFYVEDLDEDADRNIKRPYDIQYFSDRNIIISKITCGGAHTMALSNMGDIYTWGCNDSYALGRDTPDAIANSSSVPERVPFPGNYKFDLISCGDSHSACANTHHNILYQWGNCRNAKGEMFQAKKVPEIMGQTELKGKQIEKIVSGANHLFILASQVLYAWGDPETCVLGRKPGARHASESLLRIESIQKHVEDVWSGAYHGFLKKYRNRKNAEGQTVKTALYYAWGLNKNGQLGTGTKDDMHILQTEIVAFRGKEITQIAGGEHHSLGLEEDGSIYVWGKNDYGQLGLGETIEEQGLYTPEEIASFTEQQIRTKSSEVRVPHKVQLETKDGEPLKVKQILAGSNFSYAFTTDEEHQLYSWGMGDNYVLGTRGESTKFKPFNLYKDKILLDEDVQQIALSSQHVCYITSDDLEAPKVDPEVLKHGLPQEMFEKSAIKQRGRKLDESKLVKSEIQQRKKKSPQKKMAQSTVVESKRSRGKKHLGDPLDMKDMQKSLKNVKSKGKKEKK